MNCVGCGGADGGYVVAECAGPNHESGCGAGIDICGDCLKIVERIETAKTEFNFNHFRHVDPTEPCKCGFVHWPHYAPSSRPYHTREMADERGKP